MTTQLRKGQPRVHGAPELTIEEMQARIAELQGGGVGGSVPPVASSPPADDFYECEWWECIDPDDGGRGRTVDKDGKVEYHPIYRHPLKVGESPRCPVCGSRQAWERRGYVENPAQGAITVS